MNKFIIQLLVVLCISLCGCQNKKKPVNKEKKENLKTEKISLNSDWTYANEAVITSGKAVLYKASSHRKNIIIGINAGHGTKGGNKVKTYCHPDHSKKTTGGTTKSGATKAAAVSTGMRFYDGTLEAEVNLNVAKKVKNLLLKEGFDVLMVRDGNDVQLDNVARTVICNNIADCHIAIHYDGDGLKNDKGCFYCSVPEPLKKKEPVKGVYKKSEKLGDALIKGLKNQKLKISGKGKRKVDLTQTSYSTIPSIDIEIGNAASKHTESENTKRAKGLVEGIISYFK